MEVDRNVALIHGSLLGHGRDLSSQEKEEKILQAHRLIDENVVDCDKGNYTHNVHKV